MTDPSDEVTVVCDVHEPDEIKVLSLGNDDVDNWTEQPLDAADLVVNGVGFERKTPSDFAQSVLDDRLDEQPRKLGQAFDHAYVLLEGSFEDFEDLSHTRLDPQSMRGMAASLTARYGIPVIPTETSELLVDYAIRLARKHTEEPSSRYLEGSVVGQDEPLGKRLWGCFEGVGPTRAGDLFDVVGSPVAFVNWHNQEDYPPMDVRLGKVDGIGEKTAQSLVEQLAVSRMPEDLDQPGAAESGTHAAVNDSEGEGRGGE